MADRSQQGPQKSQTGIDRQGDTLFEQSIVIERIRSQQPLFKLEQRDHSSIIPIIYNRKEKSLEELIGYDTKIIYLDRLTQQLGRYQKNHRQYIDVERRRLYDIINILESLKVVTRKCKNKYCWNGFKVIYQTIQEFKNNRQYNLIDEMVEANLDAKETSRREKSLEILSVGFLRLLLHEKQVWTLEEAAKSLAPSGTDDSKLKTKVRRLYDIANVLKSIGLIRKTQVDRKSAFEWVGEIGLDDFYNKIKDTPIDEKLSPIKIVETENLNKKIKVEEPTQQKSSDLIDYIVECFLKGQKNQILETSTEKKVARQINSIFIKVLSCISNNTTLPLTQFTSNIRNTFTIIHPPSNKSKNTPRKTQSVKTENQEF